MSSLTYRSCRKFSLIESEATTGRNATFFEALAFDKDLGATRGIDAALKSFDLDALILPAPGLTTVPAAIAGYPIVTGGYTSNLFSWNVPCLKFILCFQQSLLDSILKM